jgi:hypothetical protein
MDLFHNEIISFCLRKATIKLAAGEEQIILKLIAYNSVPLCIVQPELLNIFSSLHNVILKAVRTPMISGHTVSAKKIATVKNHSKVLYFFFESAKK